MGATVAAWPGCSVPASVVGGHHLGQVSEALQVQLLEAGLRGWGLAALRSIHLLPLVLHQAEGVDLNPGMDLPLQVEPDRRRAARRDEPSAPLPSTRP